MKLIKLMLLLAIVLSAGSLLGYFNVSFNDTVLPNATRNLVLSENPDYPLDPGVANRWAVQLYGTGPDDQIDPIGLFGAVTDDDFVILPTIHQNASFGMFFSSTGRWQPSGIRFYTNAEIAGGSISQAPTGSKVYLRIYNSPVIAEATKYFQFLIPYTVPSSVTTVPVIATGLGWTPWTIVPGHGPVDTYQLSISSLPEGIHEILKGGVPTGNNTPWTSEALQSSETLLGTYSLTAGTGYHWEPASIDVTAEDFTAPARTAYQKAISFTKVLNPGYYDFTLTSSPSGAAIFKDGTNTGFVTPHVFSPGLPGVYTVELPSYSWSPSQYELISLSENTTIDFVGTLNQLSITSNHVARVSLNGLPIEPPVYTTGTETPVMFSAPGLYSVVKANTAWTPESYQFNALASQAVRFVGVTTPEAVTNPNPANGHEFLLPYNAPQTAVYTLSWGAVTDVTGYKVYFGADPATPELLGTITTTSIETPAIGEGAYTWRVVPYVIDPAKGGVRNLAPVKSVSINNTRGDGPAVDWHFTIVRVASLSITSNYVAEVYLNGAALVPPVMTTGTEEPVVVNEPGTYTLMRPNTTWNPASFLFNSPTAQAVRFVGSAIPGAAMNPVPANNHVFQIPFTAPQTAVYSLSWDAVTGVNGYRVYFGADPATPTMLGDITVGTSVDTPAIGEGAYTWRVVPYINDPAKGRVNLKEIRFSRGDGPAVDWHFTIERLPEVHTYTYNLQVNGPAGYAVTGPVNGTTPYLATDNDETIVNSLLGSYSIAAAPADFHWAVNPIVVQASDFVLARANYVYNATITFVLEANIPAATPTFTPVAGTYTTAQNVSIACATAGAQIRYTTDGTEPTATSTLYSTPINVAVTTTIKAKAFKTDWLPSATATAAYVITGTVATPTFSPVAGTYTTAQSVTIACTTTGAEIRYTIDGTEPTATSTLYSAAINVAVTTTIKAKAFKTDWTPSATATAAYTITGTVATPTFSPVAGTYTTAQSVTLACTTAGAQIRYTIDGTEPTATSTLYSAAINVAVTTTIKAKAFKTDWTPSATATAAYTITGTVATPTFSPVAGTYTTAQNVTLACTTAGAQIRYTIDGTEPTATSTLYSAAINVAVTTTIKAKAFKTDWTPSATATAAYTITGTVATPTFSPVAGTYTTAQNVTLACTTAGAQIRYTIDGTEPTATSTLYSAAINVAVTTTIKAKAFKTDWTPSATATAAYTITGTVATPTFSPVAGTYTTAQNVTLACTTAGAQIRYTTDGTEPTATSTLYSAAINVAVTTTIKAKAFKTDWTPSATATAAYVITGTVATPTFSPAPGTYQVAQNVTLACATAGAEIRYTIDGSEPTATSTLYTTAINVATTTTIKAKAFKTDWDPSQTAVGLFDIAVANPEEPNTPIVTGISNVYPNPFSGSTTIKLGVKEANQPYQLKIYNIKGECVYQNSGSAKGSFDLKWNGNSNSGEKLPSGIYLISFTSGSTTQTRKAVIK